jgi:hypothetical protein
MKILIAFIIIILLIIIPLTAMGVIPGLSQILGAGPKNLGIKVTLEDSKLARDKVGTEIIPLPANTNPNDDFKLEGKMNADFSMDSKELTAHSNFRPWKYYPLKNVQIKIHNDGTIEASATLVIEKALPYAMGLGYSETQIKDALKKYNIPPFEVPFYIKGKGSVANDKVNVNAISIQIGVVPLPANIINQINSEAKKVIEDVIAKNSQSFHAERVSFSDGKMLFKGQVAQKEYVITE